MAILRPSHGAIVTVPWRIWYDDGSTFDASQGPVEAAPPDGVIAVADGRKPRPRSGQDYYFWLGDSWAVGGQADLERWLRRVLPTLKFGRWAPNSVYDETIARATQEWPDIRRADGD